MLLIYYLSKKRVILLNNGLKNFYLERNSDFMKHININLQPSEAERIAPQVLKMMESTTPIIFRDVFGRMFVMVHGFKNRGFLNYSEESLREYVEAHSNLKSDEQLYILSCFSATNKLKSNLNKMYVETEYPVFYNGVSILDEYDAGISFDIITDDSEVNIFARELANILSISEEEASSIIINGE